VGDFAKRTKPNLRKKYVRAIECVTVWWKVFGTPAAPETSYLEFTPRKKPPKPNDFSGLIW
tara:strand:+ start:360 stop:542 length:183 start_codon:yes stop_codon:yes gene_type:complete